MSTFTHVLVIGSGAYGASTALELARLGHRVTVLERSADGNAADNAASNDLNKIIRADYEVCVKAHIKDQHYRDLCKKAIHHWRSSPILSKFYHETGVIFRSGMHLSKVAQWVEKSVKNAVIPVTGMDNNVDKVRLPQAYAVNNSEEAVGAFPPTLRPHLGVAYREFGEQVGYFNPQGGWAEAKNATFAVLDEARHQGAEVITNARVTSLIYAEPEYGQAKPRVIGAVTADGREFYADRVVLCAGCWTAPLLDQFKLPLVREIIRPTAHFVLTLKLVPEIAQKFRGSPVTFNMFSGLYTFEPNGDGILKCAIHGKGSRIPSPAEYNGTEYPSIPSSKQVDRMIAEIQTMFPLIQVEGPNKNAAVHFTRYCWYSDTIDENFLIDFHPNVDGLLVATGDSGHGFKFLPMLGRLISARLLHLESGSDELVPDFGLSSHQRRVFSFAHHLEMNDPKNSDKVGTDSIRIGAEADDPETYLESDARKAKL